MLKFYKYQGAGNDFILFDNRERVFPMLDRENNILKLCDRRFGIGADGVMLLENSGTSDFKMIYYNSDGKEGSMCGNGGRCIVSFANDLGIIDHKTTFMAVDGLHDAFYHSPLNVELHMKDVTKVDVSNDYAVLDTGSPHYVKFVNDVGKVKVFAEGREIRNSLEFAEKGINVNFVQKEDDHLIVYTYERGVEAETLACGTGVTASVIAFNEHQYQKNEDSVEVYVKGGKLKVNFKKVGQVYTDIWLIGPAIKVFEGVIEI